MVPRIPGAHHRSGIALVADRQGRASREIVERGLAALRRVALRGPVDVRAGLTDSAGLLTAIPWDVVTSDLPTTLRDPAAHRIAAMFALDHQQADRAIVAAGSALRRLGWHVMAWREVPMRVDVIADSARRAAAPRLIQCFARAPRHRQRRTPYRTRLAIEARWMRLGLSRCSVTSLSDSTMIYKGLVEPSALPFLFPDLADPRFASPFALLHQESAEFGGTWNLAQPFHAIAHSGEVNTIVGNRLWMEVRVADAGIRDDADLLKAHGSDSQTLDAAIQWLRESGLSTPQALARLLPAAWETNDGLPSDVRAFHRHESCFAEPWDGPAAVAFADGRYAGATVDRNGSRALETIETSDLVCVAWEPGVFELPERAVVKRERLGPGEMIVVDLESGTLLQGESASRALASEDDYADLCRRFIHRIAMAGRSSVMPPFDLRRQHRAFGWTSDELGATMPSITTGEATDDRISLRILLGRRGQWTTHALPPVLLELDSPVLLDQELAAVLEQTAVRAAMLSIGFDANGGGEALRKALHDVQTAAVALTANGTRIIVLTDRRLEPGRSPIPPLLATAAVDAGLRAARLRLRASIIVDTGAVRDQHHVATICGVGASAVVPYLVYATAADVDADPESAGRCRTALECGLRTILANAGISSFDAYISSRLFETAGLNAAVLRHFGEASALAGGPSLDDLAADIARRSWLAATGWNLSLPRRDAMESSEEAVSAPA